MTVETYLEMLQARRRYHLRRLSGEDESQKAFAKRLGLNHCYFCGLLAGIRPFSEKRARMVEEACGLAFGFLDSEVTT